MTATAWDKSMSDALDEVGAIGWDQAQKLARTAARIQQDTAPVLTGRGKRSVSVWKARDARGPYIAFGPWGGFHLRFYEYGTSRQPARPFIRPAIERAIAEVWPR